MYKREIERGEDRLLGQYWQVFFSWEHDGKSFRFGGARVSEEMFPEEDHLEEVSLWVIEQIESEI